MLPVIAQRRRHLAADNRRTMIAPAPATRDSPAARWPVFRHDVSTQVNDSYRITSLGHGSSRTPGHPSEIHRRLPGKSRQQSCAWHAMKKQQQRGRWPQGAQPSAPSGSRNGRRCLRTRGATQCRRSWARVCTRVILYQGKLGPWHGYRLAPQEQRALPCAQTTAP